ADAQVGVLAAVDDLAAQRLHDPAHAARATNARVEVGLEGACAARELVAPGGAHGALSIPGSGDAQQAPTCIQAARRAASPRKRSSPARGVLAPMNSMPTSTASP